MAIFTFVISAMGNAFPDVLHALDRNGSGLRDGQWWRIITPLLVQDGGWVGTIFNIVSLLVLGTFVEALFRRRNYILLYLIAGIVSEIFAYTLLQHQGFAGNSVAVMGLAGLLSVTGFKSTPPSARVIGAIGLMAGIGLIVMANLHGVGFAVGAITGVIVTVRPYPAEIENAYSNAACSN